MVEQAIAKLKNLADELARPHGRFHAVVDGAHFNNLPQSIQDADLDFRPLYHGRNTHSGPHLIHPRNATEIEQVLDIVGDLPAVVWWDWPDDMQDSDAAIFQHLRRLGMIEVPAEHLPRSRGEQTVSGPEYQQILFRHADPRVLSIMLPELEEDQWRQLMGAAYALIFVDPDVGLQVALHPDILDG